MTVRSQILSYFETIQTLILMFHRQCVVDQDDGRLLWTWLRKRHVQDQGTSPPPSLTFISQKNRPLLSEVVSFLADKCLCALMVLSI